MGRGCGGRNALRVSGGPPPRSPRLHRLGPTGMSSCRTPGFPGVLGFGTLERHPLPRVMAGFLLLSACSCLPPAMARLLCLPLPPPINRGRRCKDFTSHPSRLAGGVLLASTPCPPPPSYLSTPVAHTSAIRCASRRGVGGARCVTFLCCFRGCLPRGCTVSRRSAAQVQRLRRQGLRLLPLRCHLGGEAPMQAPRGWGEVGGLLAQHHLRGPGYGRRRPRGWG